MSPTQPVPDMICVCHLRWDFVYQRPQHLMSRFAAIGRVFYIEEPVNSSGPAHFVMDRRDCGVIVVTPHVPDTSSPEVPRLLRTLLDRMIVKQKIGAHYCWLYTPMALEWVRHLCPAAVIYDCMDELSGFKNAPADLKERERHLLEWADVVFTGGQSLFEAKRKQHHNIYPFPSSIDAQHFARARSITTDPADQVQIPHPRLGFCGVIDERMDLNLLATIADERPDWHTVMVGPVVKIDQKDLPRRPNLHYLGLRTYDQLPNYIAGWDVALLPFARNESTRFISPTKTPEYLAAGRPVVSTPIRDVVNLYGKLGFVHIAETPASFIAAIEKAMVERSEEHLRQIDAMLSMTSWSRTWGRMRELIEDIAHKRSLVPEATGPKSALSRSAAAGGVTVGS
jgi:UDP-galactopyranose mutase